MIASFEVTADKKNSELVKQDSEKKVVLGEYDDDEDEEFDDTVPMEYAQMIADEMDEEDTEEMDDMNIRRKTKDAFILDLRKVRPITVPPIKMRFRNWAFRPGWNPLKGVNLQKSWRQRRRRGRRGWFGKK